MAIEELLARGAQIFVALIGAYLAVLWFVSIVWAYRDIEARSRSVVTQIFSTLLVVLFPFLGVPLYLILRPKDTLDAAFQKSLEEEYLLQDLEELPLCPTCQHFVAEDFQLCPHCHTQLRDACVACDRLVDLRWSLCPYCGADQSGRDTERPVEAPAARWVRPVETPVAASDETVTVEERPAVATVGELAARRGVRPESGGRLQVVGGRSHRADEIGAAGEPRRGRFLRPTLAEAVTVAAPVPRDERHDVPMRADGD